MWLWFSKKGVSPGREAGASDLAPCLAWPVFSIFRPLGLSDASAGSQRKGSETQREDE